MMTVNIKKCQILLFLFLFSFGTTVCATDHANQLREEQSLKLLQHHLENSKAELEALLRDSNYDRDEEQQVRTKIEDLTLAIDLFSAPFHKRSLLKTKRFISRHPILFATLVLALGYGGYTLYDNLLRATHNKTLPNVDNPESRASIVTSETKTAIASPPGGPKLSDMSPCGVSRPLTSALGEQKSAPRTPATPIKISVTIPNEKPSTTRSSTPSPDDGLLTPDSGDERSSKVHRRSAEQKKAERERKKGLTKKQRADSNSKVRQQEEKKLGAPEQIRDWLDIIEKLRIPIVARYIGREKNIPEKAAHIITKDASALNQLSTDEQIQFERDLQYLKETEEKRIEVLNYLPLFIHNYHRMYCVGKTGSVFDAFYDRACNLNRDRAIEDTDNIITFNRDFKNREKEHAEKLKKAKDEVLASLSEMHKKFGEHLKGCYTALKKKNIPVGGHPKLETLKTKFIEARAMIRHNAQSIDERLLIDLLIDQNHLKIDFDEAVRSRAALIVDMVKVSKETEEILADVLSHVLEVQNKKNEENEGNSDSPDWTRKDKEASDEDSEAGSDRNDSSPDISSTQLRPNPNGAVTRIGSIKSAVRRIQSEGSLQKANVSRGSPQQRSEQLAEIMIKSVPKQMLLDTANTIARSQQNGQQVISAVQAFIYLSAADSKESRQKPLDEVGNLYNIEEVPTPQQTPIFRPISPHGAISPLPISSSSTPTPPLTPKAATPPH